MTSTTSSEQRERLERRLRHSSSWQDLINGRLLLFRKSVLSMITMRRKLMRRRVTHRAAPLKKQPLPRSPEGDETKGRRQRLRIKGPAAIRVTPCATLDSSGSRHSSPRHFSTEWDDRDYTVEATGPTISSSPVAHHARASTSLLLLKFCKTLFQRWKQSDEAGLVLMPPRPWLHKLIIL